MSDSMLLSEKKVKNYKFLVDP